MKYCDIFLIFAQNIDCGYRILRLEPLDKAVLTSFHNLCFQAKLRKKKKNPVHLSGMLWAYRIPTL